LASASSDRELSLSISLQAALPAGPPVDGHVPVHVVPSIEQ
jgi:hypothetical protein